MLERCSIYHAVFTSDNPFLLNVGFIIRETVGYSRDFQFEDIHIAVPPDLELHDLNGAVRIERTNRGLLAHFHMSAVTLTECVRCLNTFPQPLEVNFTELFVFSSQSKNESELVVPNDGIIDIAGLVREYMLLEDPIKPLCKPDCKGLCKTCGSNLNEIDCKHDDSAIDPRLEKLKSLLDEQESNEISE